MENLQIEKVEMCLHCSLMVYFEDGTRCVHTRSKKRKLKSADIFKTVPNWCPLRESSLTIKIAKNESEEK